MTEIRHIVFDIGRRKVAACKRADIGRTSGVCNNN